MKTWKITWYDGGMKEQIIQSGSLWNIASEISSKGIPEWSVIRIEQIAVAA
jgi:hypothetical protein